jgi:hypothetical protein
MDDFREYLKPGMRVAFFAERGDEVLSYGGDGCIVYQGYQVIGTDTFLIIDHLTGSGKKTKTTTTSINAKKVTGLTVITDNA